jgi:hypothetical protein
MSTKDILFQCLSVQFLALSVVSRETLIRVRNEDPAVTRPLEGTENTRPCRRAFETDIKIAFEGTGSIFIVEGFCQSKCAVRVCDTLVFVGETKFRQCSTGNKETSCIC